MAIYLKLFLTAVFWGGTFVAARVVAQDVGPYGASFLRFLVASLGLCALLLNREGRFPSLEGHQMLPAFLLGMTGVFAYHIFFFLGLKTIAAGRASLIVATNPVFIALLSALLFRERWRWAQALGVVLCLIGAALVISRGDPASLVSGGFGQGELLICGCAASWVAYSLIGKAIMKDCPPLTAVTYACLIGATALLPAAGLEALLGRGGTPGLTAWVGILYLGLFGTVLGFVWYYEGIRQIGPSRAAVFINVVPVSGVFFGWWLLGEPVNGSLLAGGALVLAGVALTNRSPVVPPVTAPVPPPAAKGDKG